MDNVKSQFILYVAVGALGTLGHYAALIAMVEILSIDPLVGSSIGFLIGALINYTLNRIYTFRVTAGHLIPMLRFGIVASFGAMVNLSMLFLLHDILGLHYLVSQVFATGAVVIVTFIANKYWSFSENSNATL